MKKLMTLCLCVSAFSAIAQEFKPFKINGSIGLAAPVSEQQKAGFLFSVEPKYGITDHFDVGVHLEVAYLRRVLDEQTLGAESLDEGAATSYILTASYLFSKGHIRPYLRAGFGNYRVYATSFETPNPQSTYITTAPVSRPGGMLAVGVKVGHVHLSAEYNLIASSKTNTPTLKVNNHNSYLGFKAGIDLGGGER
ncbi:porin family protein [Rhodocytophaga rosea]|uniref:Porin family protein n=1 Tax=Rhodocytophaga rosea TaxID=2704465 RepID=A0A6C0GH20_9BACT|nr:outer membrane beta-barrel protein [Rhodocytophaga rosea]QHT66990.1 porin family protein [Rhodocytophaga rosea]